MRRLQVVLDEAGNIRKGVFGHELVQGQTIKACQSSTEQQETGGPCEDFFFFFSLNSGSHLPSWKATHSARYLKK